MFDVEQIQLDFRAKTPLYLQLSDQLRQQVERGWLQSDEQLPPVRTLAERLGVNFNTVARAYRTLDIEGWISTQQGRGTFVTTQSWPRPAAEETPSFIQSSPSELAPGDLSPPVIIEPAKAAVDQPILADLEDERTETQIQPAEEIQHQDRNMAIAYILAQAAAEGITPEEIRAYLLIDKPAGTAPHSPLQRAPTRTARKENRRRRMKPTQSTERRLTRPTPIVKRNPVR